MSQHYELLFIMPVTVEEEKQPAVLQEVADHVAKLGGTVTKNEPIGKRKLTYPINHQQYGTYAITEFDLDTAKLAELHTHLKLMTDVVRSLIVKKRVKTAAEVEEEERIKQKIHERKVREAHVAAAEKQQVEAAGKAVEQPTEKKEKEKEKLSLDELDQKLDEILKDEL